MNINVACATNNFGLGPVGKLSNIVSTGKNFNWFAIGNQFDTNIFENNSLKGCLWSKDEKEIEDFVTKNNIKYAVVVLDAELVFIFMKLGVKVVFVDSLPFMWTQADIDENLLPLNVDVYCAQKCIHLTESSKKVLAQIKNLCWVNPIGTNKKNQLIVQKSDYALINLGGLHSPFGNGEYYVDVICPTLFKALSENNYKNVILTCGTQANRLLRTRILNYAKENQLNAQIETFSQNEFHEKIKNADLFLTSPGLTTIYETKDYNVKTILLPPQNLSQFYNIKFGKQLLKYVKAVDFGTKELSDEGINQIVDLGESKCVEIIYDRINNLNNEEYKSKLYTDFYLTISKEFEENANQVFMESNGAEEILHVLENLSKEN